MADQKDLQEEINEMWAEKANEDKDELMEELNELVELDDLAELDGFVLGEKEVAKNQQIGVINPGKQKKVEQKVAA